MSHKIAAPPIAPFTGGRTVIVDKSSSSLIEDGTWANPYKTIQAALNAKTAYDGVDPQTRLWSVKVVSGIYDESLTIPTSGSIVVEPTDAAGFVYLGTPGGTARSVTWVASPIAGDGCALTLRWITVTGTLDFSSPSVTATPTMTLEHSTVMGHVRLVPSTGVVTTPGNPTLRCTDSTEVARIQLPAVVAVLEDSTSGVTNCYRLTARRSTFNGGANTSDAAFTDNYASDCVFTSYLSTEGNFSNLIRTSVASNFGVVNIIGGSLTVLDCLFGSSAQFGRTLALVNTRFEGQVTFSNTALSPAIYNCVVLGNLAGTAVAFDKAHASSFTNITLAHVPLQGFFSCVISGTFTGPANSYKVDAATLGASSPAFGGAATLSLIQHGSSHTDGTDDVPDMEGDLGAGGVHGLVPAPGAGDAAAGAFLKADGTWAVPAGSGLTLHTKTINTGLISKDFGSVNLDIPVDGSETFILGFFIRRTGAGAGVTPTMNATIRVQAYSTDGFSDFAPITLIGSPYMGAEIPNSMVAPFGTWLAGPHIENMGAISTPGIALSDKDSTSEWHLKVTNNVMGGDGANDASFQIRVAYLVNTVSLVYP